MNLDLEEQTLVATFRGLDAGGKKDVLRYASKLHKNEADASLESLSFLTGQCRLEKEEGRPEHVAEPIFTE